MNAFCQGIDMQQVKSHHKYRTSVMHQQAFTVRLLSEIIAVALFGFVIFGESSFADQNVYLFSYFSDTPYSDGNDGLHLAYSLDGLSYHALDGNAAVTPPMVGTTTARSISLLRVGRRVSLGSHHFALERQYADRVRPIDRFA